MTAPTTTQPLATAPTTTKAKASKPGRHRSAAADEAILSATLDVLRERGYVGLTVASVIERSGVSSATLYRRWPTKQDLVAAAITSITTPSVDTDTGSLPGDIAAFVRDVAKTIAARGEFMNRLSIDLKSDANLCATLREKLLAPRLADLQSILGRAVERGELPKQKAPSADVALSLIIGPVYHRAFVLDETLTPAFLRTVAGFACAGLVESAATR
jgi:AcrR family transcriptional regulator